MGALTSVARRLLCGTTILLPGIAAAAAQSQAPGPQPDTQPPPPASLEVAGPPAQEPREATPIVVTGSRIPRINLTAVSPVTVVGKDEVKLEGSIMAEELLDQLPQVAPSQGAFQSNGATGTATVDLRNLGAGRTLVLVNGRRLGPGDPLAPVADLNTIPTTLIQRVEVLTGGASSVYGSDAISGVVNFILDTRFNGLRVDGQASVYQHDNRGGSGLNDALIRRGIDAPTGNTADGGRQDINVAFGHGFLDDRAHVTLYAGYRHLEELRQDRRDYSACTATESQRDASILDCGGSFASYPGNFLTNFDLLTIGPDRTFEPGATPFNFGPWNFYQRPDRRYTAGGFADVEISKAINPYLELMWMDDRSVVQVAPTADFGNTTTINCDNPLLSEQQRSLVCFDGNYNGQFAIFDDDGNLLGIEGSPTPCTDPFSGATYVCANLSANRRAVESGGRQEDLRHKSLRALGGFKGDLGRGVTYDASYLFSRATMSAAHLNDFSITRLQRALDVVTDPDTGQPVCRSVLTGEDPNCVPWDIFALGAVTPQANAYLSLPSFRHGALKEQIANANATVDLGEWGIRSPWSEEAPALNLGAEYRKDRLDYEPDALAQSGDLAGNSQNEPPVHASTEVKELFAEARLPLVTGRLIERLAFEGGYRRSWYTGGDASFSTTAYKLALDFTPIRGLRFRASHQRAVRAPNINELFTPPVTDVFNFDPCAGPSPDATAEQCALTGLSSAQYGRVIAIPDNGFFGYNAVTGGNRELQPEVATTRTIGVVLEPRFLPGFNATVDWWDIKLRDAISYVDGDTIVQTCVETADPIFCDRIHRDPKGSLWLSPQGFVDTRYLNIGSYKVRGVDVGANYRRKLGRFGSTTAEFLGSYLDKWITDNGGLSTPFDCAGRYNIACYAPTPRWRHKARLTLDSRAGVSVSVNWRYTGKLLFKNFPGLEASPLTARLPARSFFDLTALFHVEHNFVLRLGVNNIFDKEPPLVVSGSGACGAGCNGNTYPQWYDPLGRFIFAGVTANF